LQRAIKRLKGAFAWEKVVPMRELQSLMQLTHHANIVQLHEVHLVRGVVHFVFEYVPNGSLHDLMMLRAKAEQGPLEEIDVRAIVQQVLQGLEHLHRHGLMHRDIKPENLLLAGTVVKVADFSMARGLENMSPLTSYVSTRWYRAPEVLLASPDYDQAVDIFATGCILAELLSLEPLFPGRSEIDQLQLIFALMGQPTSRTWKEGFRLLQRLGVIVDGASTAKASISPRQGLVQHLPSVSAAAVDFTFAVITLNPRDRLTASEALRHPFLKPLLRQPILVNTTTSTPARSKASSGPTAVTITPFQRPSMTDVDTPERLTHTALPVGSAKRRKPTDASEMYISSAFRSPVEKINPYHRTAT
jgi:protein kinase